MSKLPDQRLASLAFLPGEEKSLLLWRRRRDQVCRFLMNSGPKLVQRGTNVFISSKNVNSIAIAGTISRSLAFVCSHGAYCL